MKYIKNYEDNSYFDTYFDKKVKEYEKYEGKYLYIHFNPINSNLIIKMLYIQNNVIRCKIYDWDENYKAFGESESNLHIEDIEVIKSFNSLRDANNFIKDMDNFNL